MDSAMWQPIFEPSSSNNSNNLSKPARKSKYERGRLCTYPSALSDSDVVKDMELILEILSDNGNEDWRLRSAALGNLQLLLDYGANNMPSFLPLLIRMKSGLSAQILDQRSALSKEACAVLGAIAASIADDFEPFAEYFVPVLFKMAINTVGVMAENAHQCIIAILRHCHKLSPIIPLVVNAVKGTHPVLRLKAIEYLLVILEELSYNSLERFSKEIENCLSKCLSDAQPEVRSFARQAFWRYYNLFSIVAQNFMSTLEPNVQKQLHQDRPTANNTSSSNHSHQGIRRVNSGGNLQSHFVSTTSNNTSSSTTNGLQKTPNRTNSGSSLPGHVSASSNNGGSSHKKPLALPTRVLVNQSTNIDPNAFHDSTNEAKKKRKPTFGAPRRVAVPTTQATTQPVVLTTTAQQQQPQTQQLNGYSSLSSSSTANENTGYSNPLAKSTSALPYTPGTKTNEKTTQTPQPVRDLISFDSPIAPTIQSQPLQFQQQQQITLDLLETTTNNSSSPTKSISSQEFQSFDENLSTQEEETQPQLEIQQHQETQTQTQQQTQQQQEEEEEEWNEPTQILETIDAPPVRSNNINSSNNKESELVRLVREVEAMKQQLNAETVIPIPTPLPLSIRNNRSTSSTSITKPQQQQQTNDSETTQTQSQQQTAVAVSLGGGRGVIAVDASSVPVQTSADVPPIASIMKRIDDAQWLIRRDCFVHLKDLASFESRRIELQTNSTVVLSACVSHLSDGHFKVSIAVMEFLEFVVRSDQTQQFSALIEPHLEKILPLLFVKFGDTKDAVKSSSQQLTKTICQRFPPQSIFSVLLKLFQTLQLPKVKLTCLQTISEMIPNSGSFFSSDAHMKSMLNRLLPFILDKQPTLKKAVASILIELYKQNQISCVCMILLLPLNIEIQLEARKVLRTHNPDVDKQFKEAKQ